MQGLFHRLAVTAVFVLFQLLLRMMQVLSRGLGDQQMRIKSMKLENKELRQQLADNASLWHDLQHDLVTLNSIPEGKGRRQQVRLVMKRLLAPESLSESPYLQLQGVTINHDGRHW